MEAKGEEVNDKEEEVTFDPVALEFDCKFLVRYRVKGSCKINVANSYRVAIRKGKCPVIKGFKKVGSSRVFLKEPMLVFINKVKLVEIVK